MKKFLAVLCVLTILLIFPLTLLSTVVKYRLLNVTVIKQLVRSSELAENLPSLAASALVNSNKNANGATNDVTVDPDTTEAMITAALPANDVYAITDQVIDTIGQWSITRKPIEQLALKIDLTKVKQNLAPIIDEKLKIYLDDLPICDNTDTITAFPTDGSADLGTVQRADCIPANINITALFNGNEQTVSDGFMQKIPNELTLDTVIKEQLERNNFPLESLNRTVNQLRTAWQWLGIGIWIGWGILAFCFLLIILLRHKPGYSTFGWLSATHLFMTLELAPLTIVLWLAPQLLLPWFSTTINSTGVTIINNILTQAMRLLSWPVTWAMIGTATLTIIYFIIRLIMKPAQPTAAAVN